jgi:aldose 1-epimerase
MADEQQVRLNSGGLELVLDPAVGGSIARLDWSGGDGTAHPVLRPVSGDAPGILDYGNFPLVPFSNRIRGGRFVFRGREVRIAPNLTGDPSPLHGQGWLASWTVESAGEGEAELRFVHAAGEWPWDYEARQHFTLDERGLSLVLACTNRSAEPMPCGLGHHPYFLCTSETRLDTGVGHAWTIDENTLPVDKVPAEGRYDLRDRLACGQGLDNGFGGWGGKARLETPGVPFITGLSSPDARFFQLYSPESGGFIVAEPVTHANAALNDPEEIWDSLGLKVLEPGEEMSLTAWIGLAGDHFSA